MSSVIKLSKDKNGTYLLVCKRKIYIDDKSQGELEKLIKSAVIHANKQFKRPKILKRSKY